MLVDFERPDGRSQSDALANRLWFGAEARGRRSESLIPPSDAAIAEENRLIEALHNARQTTRYASANDPLVMGFILNTLG